MAMSGLSRLRTELFHLLVIPRVARWTGLCETLRMAKRSLRVVKDLGRIPAVAVCTVCGNTFEAPLVALLSVQDAEANLQQQFYGHKCERKDARQTAGRILCQIDSGILRRGH